MNNKLNISEINPHEKEYSDNDCMKSSDIKCAPKELDNLSNEQHIEKRDFQMVQFVQLKCIKIEKPDEEDTDGNLLRNDTQNVCKIEGNIDKSDIVVGFESKTLSTKKSFVEMQEHFEISKIKVDKMNGSEETDDSKDNAFNMKQNKG